MSPPRVVHLELHTHDLGAASAFYRELLHWESERIESPWGSYRALVARRGPTAGSSSAAPGRPGGCRT